MTHSLLINISNCQKTHVSIIHVGIGLPNQICLRTLKESKSGTEKRRLSVTKGEREGRLSE